MARPARAAGRQAPSPRLSVALAALAACANLGDPPGGPPDAVPPALVRTVPESGAVVPEWKDPVTLQFDEVIDEMATGGGGSRGGGGVQAGLAAQVILSPVAGDVEVSWRRSAIRVKPREGFKRNRVYRLELRPGIIDLRRNRLAAGRTIIFSTGPAIPEAALAGTALQWVEQRTLAQAVIEAVPRPDTVGYVTLSDSSGDFALAGIPPGDYVVYATQDQNGNRRRDRREAYDSVAVRLDTSATAVLWTFVHDTVGPRPRQAEPVDSITFRVVFSQPLAPASPLDSAMLRVFALPDTVPVRVARVLTAKQYDSLAARERAAADSLRRAADTAAARDTAPRALPRETERGRPQARAARPPAASQDTARVRRLLAQRPVPSDRVVVRVAQPLRAEARYLIRVTGARNLNGAVGNGLTVLTVPKPQPRDTTRAVRDTARPPPPPR